MYLTQINQSRRGFLQGRVTSPRQDVFLPPWASTAFSDLCNRCDDCINACDEKILVRGDGGFPEVDFNLGGCEMCLDCARACQTGALDTTLGVPWRLKAHIKQNCLALNGVICRSCAESCPRQAIHFDIQFGGKAIPLINQEQCDGCGHCYAVCPKNSVSLIKEDK
jgi:ferredoxin-type protein NapF